MGPIESIEDISAESLARFDAIIDVRSPAEYAGDRLPGAVNLPALSNQERAEVGTIYTQKSKFDARRVGAAYVARNVARHLEIFLADKPPGFRLLLYCWRGGMRSNSVATIINAVGWRVSILKGGYRTWRRSVVANLRDSDAPINVALLDGETGTAKTNILRRAGEHEVQTLDLEGLANHRGSVFGAMTGEQPAQKLFESLLWERLRAVDPARPVLVEAESALIGRCGLPPRLKAAMDAAPRIHIEAPATARAEYLCSAYADIAGDSERLALTIEKLRPFQPKDQIEEWLEFAANGQTKDLAESLMIRHYDPLYKRSRKRREGEAKATIRLDRLSPDDIDRAARQIAEVLRG